MHNNMNDEEDIIQSSVNVECLLCVTVKCQWTQISEQAGLHCLVVATNRGASLHRSRIRRHRLQVQECFCLGDILSFSFVFVKCSNYILKSVTASMPLSHMFFCVSVTPDYHTLSESVLDC